MYAKKCSYTLSLWSPHPSAPPHLFFFNSLLLLNLFFEKKPFFALQLVPLFCPCNISYDDDDNEYLDGGDDDDRGRRWQAGHPHKQLYYVVIHVVWQEPYVLLWSIITLISLVNQAIISCHTLWHTHTPSPAFSTFLLFFWKPHPILIRQPPCSPFFDVTWSSPIHLSIST